jgi:hypothetical protein
MRDGAVPAVDNVKVLVEEPSMEAALTLLLPRILGRTPFKIHTHQGKLDLLAKLPSRLRGYAAWIPATWRILIVVDRDDDDRAALEARIEAIVAEAGLATPSTTRSPSRDVVVIRLAIEELEAWYFGDWKAVRAAYPKLPATVSAKARYRTPDEIKGGTWEAFERELQRAGYFAGGLRKIEAARAIAAHMVPSRNRSPSFCALRDALHDFEA